MIIAMAVIFALAIIAFFAVGILLAFDSNESASVRLFGVKLVLFAILHFASAAICIGFVAGKYEWKLVEEPDGARVWQIGAK